MGAVSLRSPIRDPSRAVVGALQARVNLGGERRSHHLDELVPQFAPPAARERVRLEVMRDALAMPIHGIVSTALSTPGA